jgi:hypothetical protein
MLEPGGLSDLGNAGRAAWDEAIAASLTEAMASPADHAFLRPAADDRMPYLTGPDWTGLPARVVQCLGRARALRVLDAQRRLQEEYVEWRTVRDPAGAIVRVELTTELRDLWRVLATHEPARTVEIASELARRRVAPDELYGVSRPERLSPRDRARRFDTRLARGARNLNDGRDAILFMTHPGNDLPSLVEIAAAAALPCVVRDPVTGHRRCASADEVIPRLGDAAVMARTSDPVIVERLGRLAFERRLIALDDPVGVYMQGLEITRLRTPSGEHVPADWLTWSRGVPAGGRPDGDPRYQRMVLEVPETERPLVVNDLVDVATEEPIRHGGQIAELLRLRLMLRVSAPGAVRSRAAIDPGAAPVRRRACRDVIRLASAARTA